MAWRNTPPLPAANSNLVKARATLRQLQLNSGPIGAATGVVEPPKPPKKKPAKQKLSGKKIKKISDIVLPEKRNAPIPTPEPVVSPPEPVTPPPEPVVSLPEPLASPPELVVSLPEPVAPPREPVVSLPEPFVQAPLPPLAPKPKVRIDALHVFALMVAIVLACISAFFSVSGMSKIFPGSETAVIVMSSTMEAGKLIGAAWLSRYWREMSVFIRMVMTGLVAILATINAVGVFGQLSAAHLGPHVNAITATETQAVQADARIEAQNNLISDLTRRIDQIDAAIDAATKHGHSTWAMDLSRDQRKNRADLVQQRTAAETTLIELKTEQARITGEEQKANADIGILEYAATLFGIDRERMIQLLIFAMVLSCDPLSITLVVATAGGKRKT